MKKEVLRKFYEWTRIKVKIHISTDISFFFHGREIWWASIGQNIGSEQNGKNHNFERPVLIIKKFNRQTFLGVPISTQLKVSSYHHTFTQNNRQYCINLSQIRTFSSKRLLRLIGKMSAVDFQEVRSKLQKMT
jgi:mRNA interferase MazF